MEKCKSVLQEGETRLFSVAWNGTNVKCNCQRCSEGEQIENEPIISCTGGEVGFRAMIINDKGQWQEGSWII